MHRGAAVVLVVIAVCGCKSKPKTLTGPPAVLEVPRLGSFDITGWNLAKKVLGIELVKTIEPGRYRVNPGAYGSIKQIVTQLGSETKLVISSPGARGGALSMEQCQERLIDQLDDHEDFKTLATPEPQSFGGGEMLLTPYTFTLAQGHTSMKGLGLAIPATLQCFFVEIVTSNQEFAEQEQLMMAVFRSFKPEQ